MILNIENLDIYKNQLISIEILLILFLNKLNLKSFSISLDKDFEIKIMIYIKNIIKNIKLIK